MGNKNSVKAMWHHANLQSQWAVKYRSRSNTDTAVFVISKCKLVPSTCMITITKTRLYNFDPLKPHIYILKLGFTGVYIIFHISAQKHRLWVLVRGGSNEYPQSMFWAEIWKNKSVFYLKFFSFWEVNFSIYLNRHVFVMCSLYSSLEMHLNIRVKVRVDASIEGGQADRYRRKTGSLYCSMFKAGTAKINLIFRGWDYEGVLLVSKPVKFCLSVFSCIWVTKRKYQPLKTYSELQQKIFYICFSFTW